MANLFVAEWSHTWGEYHGILGVFDSREKAIAALNQHIGSQLRKGTTWEDFGEVYEVGPLNTVTAEAVEKVGLRTAKRH